jgi:hypothetical protein
MSSLFIIGEVSTVISLEGDGRCREETHLLPELGELIALAAWSPSGSYTTKSETAPC